jgi:hypothetical protein
MTTDTETRLTVPLEPDWAVADHATDLDAWHRWVIESREALLRWQEVIELDPDNVLLREMADV